METISSELDLKYGEIYDAVLLDEAETLARFSNELIFQFITKKYQTALHLAVSNNSLRILDYIASCAPSYEYINAQNQYGETVIHLVAAMGDLNLLKRMYSLFGDSAFDWTKVDQWGRSPSLLAMQNGYEMLIGPSLLPDLTKEELDKLSKLGEDAKNSFVSAQAAQQRSVLQTDFLSQLRCKQQRGKLSISDSDSFNKSEQHDQNHHTFQSDRQITSYSCTASSKPTIVVKHLFANQTVSETILGGTHEEIIGSNNFPVEKELPATADITKGEGEMRNTFTISKHSLPKSVNLIALSKMMEYPGDLVQLHMLSPYFVSGSDDIINSERTWYDINGRDFYGLTALHKACSWNKPDIVDFLLKQKDIDINATVPFNIKGFCIF